MKRLLRSILVICIGSTALFTACSKEKSFETPTSSVPQAAGTLKDSAGNCLTATVMGTYYNGIATNGDTNYVQVQVNVTTAGAYKISAAAQNGFAFSDSGSFTTLGLNTIKLKASGSPILPTSTVFSYTFDSTTCTFTIPVKDSTGTGLGSGGNTDTSATVSDSAWQFTEGSNFYHGRVDTAFVADSVTYKVMYLYGSTAATADSSWGIAVAYTGTDVPLTTYSTAQGTAAFIFYNNLDSTQPYIYTSTSSSTGTDVTVTISAFDTSTRIASGTFTGTALNSSGSVVNITGGKFKAKLQ